jgi:hypothetical protein
MYKDNKTKKNLPAEMRKKFFFPESPPPSHDSAPSNQKNFFSLSSPPRKSPNKTSIMNITTATEKH